MASRPAALSTFALLLVAGCDDGTRRTEDGGRVDVRTPPPPDPRLWIDCRPGQERCYQNIHQRCLAAGEFTQVEEDACAPRGLVCTDVLWCAACQPGSLRCTDNSLSVERCRADGSGYDAERDCDTTRGEACRAGRCVHLCTDDSVVNTNVGCEYYGVDLDNIVETAGRSAASQQYAIVVSNPDPALTVRVEVSRNNAAPGAPLALEVLETRVIPPRDLEVFELPAREVDCSTVAGLNDGTGTCLSSRAYRVSTDFPVVAYQFNPLSNVGVFSNDASLLVPTNSLRGSYRAYMTVVGTRASTRVRVTPMADIVAGGPFRERHPAGTPFEVMLHPFDVLNLESDAFLADFTGSVISADGPVAVFSGTECSNVPFWSDLADRQAACDHLETQLFPIETVGQNYVASRTPSRSRAVTRAGVTVTESNEPEWFRVLNVSSRLVRVTTTLPEDLGDPGGPTVAFDLEEGAHRDIRALADFQLRGDAPVAVAQLQGSQSTTGVPFPLPGGDPSLLIVPPVEQWRAEYVFLTPDRYSFDFVQVVARPDLRVTLDGVDVADLSDCARSRSDGCIETPTHACGAARYVTWRCQLSFPRIDDSVSPPRVTPGRQNDGVHVVHSEAPEGTPPEGVMVLVSGFDERVSYAYTGGTNLVPVR